MTVRNVVRTRLEPLIGRHRVDRVVEAERRMRTSLARRLDPPAPQTPASQTPASDAPGPELAPSGYPVYPFDPDRFPQPTLTRHELLTGLHEVVQPRTYLEIGVDDGRSLTLSRARTIGVDPSFQITNPVRADLLLSRSTSDDFFSGPEAAEFLDRTPLDLAFIDGMHLAEFAYRDFVNVEKLAGPGSVIVLDDMLPRTAHEAARDRYTDSWAGDVYKVMAVLREWRPELAVIPVNTFPTGTLLVFGADPDSTVLADHYDELLPALRSADPQDVPDGVLDRSDAVDGRELLAWDRWSDVRSLRDGDARDSLKDELIAELRERFGR
jgi:hypothetical protein